MWPAGASLWPKAGVAFDARLRDAEELARGFRGGAPRASRSAAPTSKVSQRLSAQLKFLERRLREHFGTRTRIQRKKNGSGALEIHYADDEGLQAILDVIFASGEPGK